MTRDQYDVGGAEEVYGENVPTLPNDSQPIRPAAVAMGGALFLVVVGCVLIIVSALTGWAAETVVRWLP